MISATGRIPVIAAPMAMPRMACSEIGVSQIRLRAELGEQPRGGLEHAAGRADVLAQAHHRRIAPQLPGDALGHRLPVGDQVRHAEPPSAHTSVNASAGSGAGAALAAATAAATIAAARSSAVATDVGRARPASASRAAGQRPAGPGCSHSRDLLGRPVGGRVGAAVPEVPVGQRLDHASGPPPALARAGGPADRVGHHDHVVAVDDLGRQPVGRRPVGGRVAPPRSPSRSACTPCRGCSRR